MKKSHITLFLCFISLAVFSQKKVNALVALEEKILTEKTDITAIELITEHYEAKDATYDYRIDLMNSYDEDLSKEQKKKKFRVDSLSDDKYQDLKEKEKKARNAKLKYLRPQISATRSNANGAKRGKFVRKRN